MIIGLLKEIKKDERRIALIPKDVQKLIENGHEVFFELGCGDLANYPDKAYKNVGAEQRIRTEIYDKADLIVKVKTPEQYEPKQFKKDQLLFSYLHYDGNESLIGAEVLRKKNVSAIAFEWVEEIDNGVSHYPLLTPMSEFTGILGATKILELYCKENKKIAGDFCNSIKPLKIMIIGLGTIGSNALNVFLHNGLEIIIVDKHPETIDKRIEKYIPKFLWDYYKDSIKIVISKEDKVEETIEDIKKDLPDIDILFFSAVRRETFTHPHLFYTKMLKLMKKGSFIIDAAANDKDLVESIESYPEVNKIYQVHGVWHYANDHIPTIASHDTSKVLSNSIIPYLLEIADLGFEKAILTNEALYRGVIIAGGQYTHKYTCMKRNLMHVPLDQAIDNNQNFLLTLDEIDESIN